MVDRTSRPSAAQMPPPIGGDAFFVIYPVPMLRFAAADCVRRAARLTDVEDEGMPLIALLAWRGGAFGSPPQR